MGNQNGSAEQQVKVARASRPRGWALGVMVCLGLAVGFAEPVVGESESDKASSAQIVAETYIGTNYLFVDATGQRGASTGLPRSTEFTARWEIIGPQGVLETVGAGTNIPFSQGLALYLPISSQSTILTIFSDPVMVSPLPIMSYERADRLPYRTTIPVDGEAAGLVGVTEEQGGDGSYLGVRPHFVNSIQIPSIGIENTSSLLRDLTQSSSFSLTVATSEGNSHYPQIFANTYPLYSSSGPVCVMTWGFPPYVDPKSAQFTPEMDMVGGVEVTASIFGFSLPAQEWNLEVGTFLTIRPAIIADSNDVVDLLARKDISLHAAPRWILQRAISAHRAGEVTLASHLFDQCDLNGDKLVDAADELLLLGAPEVTGWEFR